MKISTKGRYGITIMMALGRHFGKGPLSLKTIADQHQLSEHYLEQLIAPLRNFGLVKSIRGAYGGYVLAQEPKAITVAEIIRVLEGPIQPVEVMEDDDPAKRELWRKIRDAVKDVLDHTTVYDLITFENDKNVQDPLMFYI
ncbi:cysteine metabolism transcriptional regulator CymR [Camelliibacillus cellulosilyticus]|uniref:Cysteine metabolism transcriptional regulator CymR n=1 Tax=Camelliibacillus cellulosilyticus TaxID=2174486 RepID=A0ABV9GLE5_9BACL